MIPRHNAISGAQGPHFALRTSYFASAVPEPIIMWCSGALFVDGVFALFLLVFGLVQIEVTHRKLFEERAQALEREVARLCERIARLERALHGACAAVAAAARVARTQCDPFGRIRTVALTVRRYGRAVRARVYRVGGARPGRGGSRLRSGLYRRYAGRVLYLPVPSGHGVAADAFAELQPPYAPLLRQELGGHR